MFTRTVRLFTSTVRNRALRRMREARREGRTVRLLRSPRHKVWVVAEVVAIPDGDSYLNN